MSNLQALSPRLFRVAGSNYWADEVMLSPRTHSDVRLSQVAELGFNAVWIHGELRQLHPTALYEPWESDASERLDALRVTVQRAKQHGIAVWLYVCEPRSYDVDHPFWSAHPECRGHPFAAGTHLGWRWPGVRKALYGMCLGQPVVREFLTQSTQAIFRAVPDLGGILVTTASEHHGHCYTRFNLGREVMTCPRCAKLDPTQMPATVAEHMLHGAQVAGIADAGKRLCFWSWSWHRHIEPSPCPRALAALPAPITFMSIFEMGGDTVQRLGKRVEVDEYLFSHVGPTPNFQQQAAMCRKQGRTLWAKLQVSTTHEIATVPNIPLPSVLYDKIARCREQGVSGIMSIWTMGCLPTLNSFAAAQLMRHAGPLPPRDLWLRQLAEDYFEHRLSTKQVNAVVTGWQGFVQAMQHHPAEMDFLYFGPINYAPAYPWTLTRRGTRMARSWTDEPWGDKLEMSLKQLTLSEAATLLDQLATHWQASAAEYAAALEPHAHNCRRACEERSVALAIGLFFRSCADAYRFAERVEEHASADELSKLIGREEETCRQVAQLVDRDPRIGKHDDVDEPMVSPSRIADKLKNLASLKQQIAHA